MLLIDINEDMVTVIRLHDGKKDVKCNDDVDIDDVYGDGDNNVDYVNGDDVDGRSVFLFIIMVSFCNWHGHEQSLMLFFSL